jgi:hypothetical protein
MSPQIQALPNLSAETIRTWLLQVNKDLGNREDERAIWQLEGLSRQAEEIVAQLEGGKGDKDELVRSLCELREKRNQWKAALLLMLISHITLLKEEKALGGGQDVWQDCIDKINKDVGGIGKLTESISDYMDSTHKKILDSFPDVLEYAKIRIAHGERPLSELSAKDKVGLLRIGFDLAVRWVELPPGTSKFFEFYSESIKAIGEKLGEIETTLRNQYKEHWVTFEHDDFGSLIDRQKLAALIEDRVGKIKGKFREEEARQIVDEAAKIRLLGAYNEAAKRLLTSLTTGDEVGKRIDNWASDQDCLKIRFRELCIEELKKRPSIYPGEEVENILEVVEEATTDDIHEKAGRVKKANDRYFENREKRNIEITEIFDKKREVDAWCRDKTVAEIDDLKEEQNKQVKELAGDAEEAMKICVDKRKLAEDANKAYQDAENGFKSAIEELESRHRKALKDLENKHMPGIEELEKAIDGVKKSIEQGKKDAFWVAVELEEKELSHLFEEALAADKDYFIFSDKYDPVRDAYQQTLLDSTELLLRSKQGEKISKEELSASESKLSQLEKEEQEMRGSYNRLVAARDDAWEAYNTKKAGLEAMKKKVQNEFETKIEEQKKELDKLEQEKSKRWDEYYNQEKVQLIKAQTDALNKRRETLQKELDAKSQDASQKSEIAQKVCEEAKQKQQRTEEANQRLNRVIRHQERVEAKGCVEKVLEEQRQLLLSLELVAKSERDIHSALWELRGLTNPDSPNLAVADLKEKARLLYGKSIELAEFIDSIHSRENFRTNHAGRSRTSDTFFEVVLNSITDLMKRHVQTDGSQDLKQEQEDFCTAFGTLEEGLKKLQNTHNHLLREYAMLRERLAGCLERLQDVEKELDIRASEPFGKWEEILSAHNKIYAERIETIKSQTKNEHLEGSIAEIGKTQKGFEEILNRYRPRVVAKEPVKVEKVKEEVAQKKPGIKEKTGWERFAIPCLALVTICFFTLIGGLFFAGRELVKNPIIFPAIPKQPVVEKSEPVETIPVGAEGQLTSTPQVPTIPPTLTYPPSSTVAETIKECSANFELGKKLLVAHDETGEGDCGEGIKRLQDAIMSADTVLVVEPDNPEACLYRGLSRLLLEEDLDQVEDDLLCAMRGLDGYKEDMAEAGLKDLMEMVSMPVCVSMGPPVFAESWDGNNPIKPATTFPANNTKEVWVHWSVSNPCKETIMVKWYYNGEHVCQHHNYLQDGWIWAGSGWGADGDWIESGTYCVKVFAAGKLITSASGCFTVK